MESGFDAGDMEMTTKEAAAYLSGPVGSEISVKFLYGLRSLSRGPVVEKRGRRLIYRKSTLDAFLLENGTDPTAWYAGMWREVAGQLRAIVEATGDEGFNPLISTLEKRDPRDDWDPDDAK
ncbi:helix-turn-helix domain-containing protein [Pseudarthrobacter sp. LT1]|uniref:helix-turn-helix domain-containing protein n=1 Tax=Pseudarthrobacter sp. LT1 TaxID=3111450 RepID=UPI002D7779B1|nr:helix-turn-helix domain-containing protein [Pseudarthrobacter sp. LT1]WRT15640.1 helix-turn-helix domain-containing protein [Pseudarthrobacter sp. LT1]